MSESEQFVDQFIETIKHMQDRKNRLSMIELTEEKLSKLKQEVKIAIPVVKTFPPGTVKVEEIIALGKQRQIDQLEDINIYGRIVSAKRKYENTPMVVIIEAEVLDGKNPKQLQLELHHNKELDERILATIGEWVIFTNMSYEINDTTYRSPAYLFSRLYPHLPYKQHYIHFHANRGTQVLLFDPFLEEEK